LEKVEKRVEQMKHHMKKSLRIWLILVILIVMAILAALWATSVWFPHRPFERRPPPIDIIPGDIEFFYTVETIVSTVNVTLAAILFLTYISIYRRTRSEFTIGLVIFSAVFLLNALASNPFVILASGYRPLGLGPFAFLPDLFTLGALAVLLYLSVRY